MSEAELIASLAGPAFIAIAFAMLTSPRTLRAMVGQMPDSLPVIFLAGLLLFIGGIAILRTNGPWPDDWTLSISVLGWLFVFGGFARMVIPDQSAELAYAVFQRRAAVLTMAIALLAIGAFYTAQGFRLL